MKAFKFLLVFFVAVLFSACSGNIPKSAEAVSDKTQLSKDGFSKVYFLKTPLYLSRQGMTDPFPVKVMYRALFDGNDNYLSTQLYVTVLDVSWGFYERAIGEDGERLKLTKLDGVVSAGVGVAVTTEEIMTIAIPLDYLHKMSKGDWSIKLYGKRKEGVFIVPESLSAGFLHKLICYQEGSCK